MSSAAPPRPTPPPPFLPPDEKLRREFEWPIARVEIAVVVTFIVLVITILMGLARSRYGNPFMRTLATVIFFPISNKLISYVPGLMEMKHKYDLFAFWLAFLTYLGAVANNYSCYRFGDNEDRKISLFMDYIFPWGTIAYSLSQDLIAPDVFVPVIVMFWIVLLQFRERRDALSYATRSTFGLMESTQVVYDFMRRQQTTDDVERVEDGAPVGGRVTEGNTRYLVGIKDARSALDNGDSIDKEIDNSGTGFTPSRVLLESDNPVSSLVTLDKIDDLLKDKLGERLSPTQAKKLQNTCFSFALFWMLLAKVAGQDVRTDAYKDLIEGPTDEPNKDEEKEVERIFNIIEEENDFLYQYFYTNYNAIYVNGIISKIRHLAILILFWYLASPLLIRYRPEDHNDIYVDIDDRVIDKAVTRFVIIVITLIELSHIFLLLTSNWAKIIYLCQYVRSKRSITRRIIELAIRYTSKITELANRYLQRLSPKLPYFQTKRHIAQYSLAECYNKVPFSMYFAYVIQELRVMAIPEAGQSGFEYIPLKLDLKKTFISFIKESKSKDTKKGIISNGVYTLIKYGADNNQLIDDYVCNLDSHSEVILVWHLATHNLQIGSKEVSSEEKEKQVLATTLSKYCAYLVVFEPRFLPENGYVALRVFKQAVRELNSSNSRDEIELNKQSSRLDKRSITELANALKSEIENNYKKRTWELLAEFWTEMLLFLSLSNNFEVIETHVDYLCTGGELITHLWILLNHAGCYRDPDVKPKINTRENE